MRTAVSSSSRVWAQHRINSSSGRNLLRQLESGLIATLILAGFRDFRSRKIVSCAESYEIGETPRMRPTESKREQRRYEVSKDKFSVRIKHRGVMWAADFSFYKSLI